MSVIPPRWRRRIGQAPVGHFATSGQDRPGVVPVCFVLIGETVYHALDAKPKSVEPRRLRRVRNILANPSAVMLIDHYEDDWTKLWYALIEGRARLIERGVEQRRAIAALRRKYRQYRTTVPLDPAALVIALDAAQLSHWQASSPGRRREGRRGSPA